MTNTPAEVSPIDLEALERVSLRLNKAQDVDKTGMELPAAVDEFSYLVNPTEVLALVAAVKAARAFVASEATRSNNTYELLEAALQPFTNGAENE
jgi:hypothetical protein